MKKTLLIIEDNEDILSGLVDGMGNFFKVNISQATTVAAGLGLIQNSEINAIICDYNLPDGTGLAILDLIQKRKSTIPFFLYSGSVSLDLTKVTYQNFSFVRKPNFGELVSLISKSSIFDLN